MIWETYDQHDDDVAGLDLLALERGGLRGDANILQTAGEALRFVHVPTDTSIIAVLSERLDLRPDGGVVWTEEELENLVYLLL